METNNKKGNKLTIIILLLIIIGLVGYIGYDKLLSGNKTETNDKEIQDLNKENSNTPNDSAQNNQTKYNVSDYLTISDYEINKNCIDCGTTGIVKTIEFKNLELRLVTEFNEKHEKFINPAADETAKLTNEIIYDINNNILSIYEKDQTNGNSPIGNQKYYNYYSLNIDLSNQKIITNEELVKIYNIDASTMYEKILTNIANTVSAKEFLLSTDGDVTANTLSVNEFKNNISKYAGYIDNRYDVITLYLKNNNLYVVYDQNKILSILGLGTHMGIGLVQEPQTIQVN